MHGFPGGFFSLGFFIVMPGNVEASFNIDRDVDNIDRR